MKAYLASIAFAIWTSLTQGCSSRASCAAHRRVEEVAQRVAVEAGRQVAHVQAAPGLVTAACCVSTCVIIGCRCASVGLLGATGTGAAAAAAPAPAPSQQPRPRHPRLHWQRVPMHPIPHCPAAAAALVVIGRRHVDRGRGRGRGRGGDGDDPHRVNARANGHAAALCHARGGPFLGNGTVAVAGAVAAVTIPSRERSCERSRRRSRSRSCRSSSRPAPPRGLPYFACVSFLLAYDVCRAAAHRVTSPLTRAHSLVTHTLHTDAGFRFPHGIGFFGGRNLQAQSRLLHRQKEPPHTQRFFAGALDGGASSHAPVWHERGGRR